MRSARARRSARLTFRCNSRFLIRGDRGLQLGVRGVGFPAHWWAVAVLGRPSAAIGHAHPWPVEFVGRIQLGQQGPVQPVEAPAFCHLPTRRQQVWSEPNLSSWGELPGDAVVEDERDALEAGPVRHRPQPGRPLRQQRLDQRPRSTAEYPHHYEWPNRHTSNAQPEQLNSIVLQALWRYNCDIPSGADPKGIPRIAASGR